MAEKASGRSVTVAGVRVGGRGRSDRTRLLGRRHILTCGAAREHTNAGSHAGSVRRRALRGYAGRSRAGCTGRHDALDAAFGNALHAKLRLSLRSSTLRSLTLRSLTLRSLTLRSLTRRRRGLGLWRLCGLCGRCFITGRGRRLVAARREREDRARQEENAAEQGQPHGGARLVRVELVCGVSVAGAVRVGVTHGYRLIDDNGP
jgi:hypothetical protein